MQRIIFRNLRLVLWVFPIILVCHDSYSQDTLRIMSYNLLKFPGSNPQRTDYLETILRYVQPDIMVNCELEDAFGADLVLTTMQKIRPSYRRARYLDGFDTDNLIFYDSLKVGLALHDTISTTVRPLGYFKVFYRDPQLAQTRDTLFIHIFGVHLKASQGTSEEIKRGEAATALRNFLDQRSGWYNVIAAGDYNIYHDNELAINILVNSFSGNNLYDPVNSIGDWHDNPAYSILHTQSPRRVGSNEFVGGGLDDRFDLMLVSGDLLSYPSDVYYIPGSFKVIGNDGLHFDKGINDPPQNTSAPDSVLDALYNMSDHLPIIMDLGINPALTGLAAAHAHNDIRISHFLNNSGEMVFYIEKPSGNIEAMLKITDISGRTIRQEPLVAPTTTVSYTLRDFNHPAGVYFMELDFIPEGIRRTIKFIKL